MGTQARDTGAQNAVTMVDFALPGTNDLALGDYVIKRGKIFEAGDYPDKDFHLTPEEMQAAVSAFAPVPIDIEHMPTVFDGNLGNLWSVAVDPNGKDLLGDIAVPSWLAGILPEVKVSTTWDKATKKLRGLALVRDPRVSDAVMMAAFSNSDFARKRHDTRAGQAAIQSIHNATVQAGAVCKQTAEMASRHENSTIQQIHDLTASHGATCDDGTDKNGVYAYYGSDRKRTMDKKDKRNQFLAWLLGSDTTDGEAPESDPIAEFTAMADADKSDKAVKAAREAAEAKFAADLKKEQDEKAALKAENDRLQRERITEAAANFATVSIAQGRATPSEQEAIIDAYSRAAMADAAGTVTFADGSKVGMLDAVKKLVETRSTKYATLFTEQVATESGTPGADATKVVLSARETTEGSNAPKDVTEQRRKELLAKSSAGRATLETKKN